MHPAALCYSSYFFLELVFETAQAKDACVQMTHDASDALTRTSTGNSDKRHLDRPTQHDDLNNYTVTDTGIVNNGGFTPLNMLQRRLAHSHRTLSDSVARKLNKNTTCGLQANFILVVECPIDMKTGVRLGGYILCARQRALRLGNGRLRQLNFRLPGDSRSTMCCVASCISSIQFYRLFLLQVQVTTSTTFTTAPVTTPMTQN